MSGAAAFVVIVAKKRRDLIEAFRCQEATSPSTAMSLGRLGVTKSPIFDLLLAKGVLVESEPSRYYLDEETESRMEAFRRTQLMAAFAVVALVALWLLVT